MRRGLYVVVIGFLFLFGCGTHPDIHRQHNREQIAKRNSYGIGISSGQGTLKSLFGDYEGNFHEGLFHGQGTFVWKTGHRYAGDFVNGRIQGEGTFTWPDGSRYVGPFKGGKRDGKGTIALADGGTFVGMFAGGKLVDKGVITYPDNKRIEGEFVQLANMDESADIAPPTQGTIVFPDGSRFEGEIANGSPGLIGIYLDPKGRLYDGEAKCYDEEGLIDCAFQKGKRTDTLYLVRVERIKMQQLLESQAKKTHRATRKTNAVAEYLPQIRDDAAGLYCCPYTSDGVLAEWVDTAIKSSGWESIGGGVGMAAGALVGQQLGEELLSDLPYGGLIGGIAGGLIGKKVGEEAGRDTYLNLVGGMENVRRTSDLSADNLEDLARYLYTNHADHPHYQDALKAAFGIYPDFKPVYEAVAKQ